jgi:hypothetical protein
MPEGFCIEMFHIGDRVEIRGNTQSYILVDPTRTYTGVVIGMGDGQLLVRLDEPVTRGPGKFQEVSVDARAARLVSPPQRG